MNKGDTAVLSARVHKEKQTDVIWKNNGEREAWEDRETYDADNQDLHPCAPPRPPPLACYPDPPAILLASLQGLPFHL